MLLLPLCYVFHQLGTASTNRRNATRVRHLPRSAVLLPRHEMPTGSAGYWPCAADTSSISSPLPADVPACELRARPCELVTDAYWNLKMDELGLPRTRIKRSGESWKACIPYGQPRTYI